MKPLFQISFPFKHLIIISPIKKRGCSTNQSALVFNIYYLCWGGTIEEFRGTKNYISTRNGNSPPPPLPSPPHTHTHTPRREIRKGDQEDYIQETVRQFFVQYGECILLLFNMEMQNFSSSVRVKFALNIETVPNILI